MKFNGRLTWKDKANKVNTNNSKCLKENIKKNSESNYKFHYFLIRVKLRLYENPGTFYIFTADNVSKELMNK